MARVIFNPGSCRFAVFVKMLPSEGSVLKESLPQALLFAVLVNSGFRQIAVGCPTLELSVRLPVLVSDLRLANPVVVNRFADVFFTASGEKRPAEGKNGKILKPDHIYNLEKR